MVWRVGEVATVIWNLGTSGYSDVKCQIYDEAYGAFGSPANMVEIGVTGIYYHEFTPDNDGVWTAHVYKDTDEDTFLYVVGWGVEGRSKGLIYNGTCDSGMTGSTTVIVCADLKGFGDDYFNTGYQMGINLNDNSHGAAPEDQVRDITNYVSATGTFTVAAFTVNVEANDVILIMRDELAESPAVALAAIDLDHLLNVAHPSGDPVADSILDLIMNKDVSQTFSRVTDSLEAISEAIAGLTAGAATLIDHPVIYIVAEDMATTEIIDDGSDPALTAEVSKTTATEIAGEGDPSWLEDVDFEQAGTVTIISIFYELNWQMKVTGAGIGYAKWQISDDGGTTWVDVTDNLTETDTSYVNKSRVGVGRHITTITTGVNQLELRLVAWTTATSVQTKVRSDSRLRVTYRKS